MGTRVFTGACSGPTNPLGARAAPAARVEDRRVADALSSTTWTWTSLCVSPGSLNEMPPVEAARSGAASQDPARLSGGASGPGRGSPRGGRAVLDPLDLHASPPPRARRTRYVRGRPRSPRASGPRRALRRRRQLGVVDCRAVRRRPRPPGPRRPFASPGSLNEMRAVDARPGAPSQDPFSSRAVPAAPGRGSPSGGGTRRPRRSGPGRPFAPRRAR